MSTQTPNEQTSKNTRGILVARDLDYFFEAVNINHWSDEPTINGKVFRKLNATYYLWLYTMLARAKRSYEENEMKISYFQLQIMLERFSEIHNLAIEIFGNQKIKQALARKGSLKDFKPPALYAPKLENDNRPFLKPIKPKKKIENRNVIDISIVRDNSGFTVFIKPEAKTLVDAIADQAKNLGWKSEALYNNKGQFQFPCGGDYGLVCFIKPDDEILDVTEKKIIVRSKSGMINSIVKTFFNPDLDKSGY